MRPAGSALLALGAAALALMIGLGGCGTQPPEESVPRADMLTIETLARFGSLQEPPVVFLHEKHTRALEEQNKGCKTCHLVSDEMIPFTDDKILSLKFERLNDEDKNQIVSTYHTKCIECHAQRQASNLDAGPVTCGECHRIKPDAVCAVQPLSFDNTLHARHVGANDKKCEFCHHEYNETTEKLFYEKGKEQNCRDCHGTVPDGKREPMRTVAHEGCIDCHTKKKEQKKESGPVNCFGCHELKNQQAFKKLATVPRMERNQPDAALVRAGLADVESAKMNTVPFDHKTHEAAMSTCRVCHHETMQACKDCHTIQGDKKGDERTLERSMHEMNTRTSCIGCHRTEMVQANCAGCHSHIEMAALSTSTCVKCHNGPPPQDVGPGKIPPEELAALLPPVRMSELTFAEKDIPKQIEIKGLSNEYQLVAFPHVKIIDKLRQATVDSKLATYFHAHQDTLCLGCHHKSPLGSKPALCGSCHARPSKNEGMFMPGLQAAYHLQCINCHKEMKTGPTGCTDCHKKKGKGGDNG